MAEKHTVLVDMDGVVANYHDYVIATIQSEFPDVKTHRPHSNFYIENDYPELFDEVRAICARPNFFSSLGVIRGAIDGWRSLVEAGFHPQICSAPLLTNPASVTEKLAWLERHFVPEFGSHILDEAFIERDKTVCEGLVLIDDKPVITGEQTPTWQRIMFTQSYNVAIAAEYRVNGWHDTRLIPIIQGLAKTAIK